MYFGSKKTKVLHRLSAPTTGERRMRGKKPCALFLIAGALALGCSGQTFSVLYTFSGGADGGYPQYGRLVGDSSGNLYGTATFGGDLNCPLVTYPGPGCGVVFKLDLKNNAETVLYTIQRRCGWRSALEWFNPRSKWECIWHGRFRRQ
jgi:uncharacterized repeat protein (TIGR03803 family)